MNRMPVVVLIAFKSLLNRRLTATLTILSIAVSVALLAAVDRVRTDARTSFTNTISGTDLIIGARSGELNLLLYSVFRIGNPTNNIQWSSYREISARPEVAWTIPLSLGDAHRGYRVLGTDRGYFEHYRYAENESLEFAHGAEFAKATDAVVGAEVAEQLGYEVGRQIVVSHGVAETSFVTHDEHPFTITGILAPTGTPVDRTVHISLGGMDLIHLQPGATHGTERHLDAEDHAPEAITAMMVGLKSRLSIFTLQRWVGDYEREALLAIIPGVALQRLWGLVGVAEYALFGISTMVVLAGILGLLSSLLVSLNERRREMSVLRAVGATPGHVFLLLVSEAALLGIIGAVTGLILVQVALFVGQQWAVAEFGIQLSAGSLRAFDIYLFVGVIALSVLASALPAWRAYRNSLADGLAATI